MIDDRMHDLRSFMVQATNEIRSEYERIYANAAQDPGTAGDEGEENWAALFRDWLPANFHVATKGQIIAPDGRLSPQVDIVVLEPSYPRKLREKRKWLSDGVVAAFECKTTLTAAHVSDTISRCISFKSLYPARAGNPLLELTSPLIYGLLAHSHSWKGEKSNPIDNIERSILAASSRVSHPRDLFDVICVADLATWSNNYCSWAPLKHIPEPWQPHFEREFGGPLGVTTTQFRFDESFQQGALGFTPIGVAISQIAQRMAWRDSDLRSFAAYSAISAGNGQGFQRPWNLDVYTPLTREKVERGEVTNGWPGEDQWAGWAMIGP